MRRITKTVYSFRELIELNKKGKVSNANLEKVRAKLIEWNTESNILTESVIDCTWRDVLKAVGFKNPEFSWSGFYSQGDGASFTSGCETKKLINWFTKPVEPSECYDETDLLPWLKHKIGQDYFPEFEKLMENEESAPELCVIRKPSNRYSHEHTCEVFSELYDDPNGLIRKFTDAVEELRVKICKAIYDDLYKENNDLSEDESLIELDEANEYQWDIKGHQER